MRTVFISYRHESDAHRLCVLQLGERLRGAGVNVVLDQLLVEEQPEGPDEQWGPWSINQVKKAHRVLMIGSHSWFRCFEGNEVPGSGLGAAAEANIIRSELYQSKWITGKHRIVFVDESVTSTDVPLEIKTMGKFRPHQDEDQFTKLLQWINGAESEKTAVEEVGIPWPEPQAEFVPAFANRHEEWPLIIESLSGKAKERILTIEAPGNHGKSVFIGEIRRYCIEVGLRMVWVDFKGGQETSTDVLQEIGLSLGSLLPEFHKGGCKDPYLLRHELRQLGEPVALIFDTWEHIGENANLANWFEHQFFPHLEQSPAVVAIVAGRTIPNASDHLKDLVKPIALAPILECEHWEDWIPQKFPETAKRINAGDVHIPTLVTATFGIPGTLCTLLSGIETSLRQNPNGGGAA